MLITLIVCSMLYGFNHTNIANRLEQLSYDYHLSTSRDNKILPPQVLVVLIDESSLKIMDPVVGRWPWPRSIYHNLIKYIASGQPKAILFDILFSERQLNEKNGGAASSDELLIEATASSQLSHHSMQFIPAPKNSSQIETPFALTPNIIDQHGLQVDLTEKLHHLSHTTQDITQFEDFIAPIKGLITASKQLGIVNATADNDGIYRQTELFYKYNNAVFPSLSIASLLSTPQYRQTIIEHQNRQYQSKASTPVAVNFYTDYRPLSMGAILSSMSNLYAGEIEKVTIAPDVFSNKYIFIGANAIGLHDLKPTPISTLAPGVFVHASMLANIISKDLLKPVNATITVMSVILASFLTALAVILIRNIYLQIATPIILTIACFNFVSLAMQNNYIANYTLPSIAIISSWLFASLFLFATEKREKGEIRKMFSQYVSPAALSVMVDKFKDYKTLGHGSEEYVTVLFSDIRGFTSLSEELEAKEVVTVLNYYFSTMTEVIFKHNGTIDKFIGDAIMATWGAPIPSTNHAMDAVRAAIDMHIALDQVNQWLLARQLGAIKIGIGVHTGSAILGSIGSAQKADYTVIGDTVNLASRLEGITKLYQTPIIISESSYRELNGTTPCQILDRVQVKGKSQSVDIYTPILYNNSVEVKTKQQANIIEQTSLAAFQQYQSKNWLAARNLLKLLPSSYPSKALLEKCDALLEAPPDDDWNRVNIMSSK